MPYIDVSLRQALGLMTSCPSTEDIAAAAAARGLQLRPDGHLVAIPPATATAPKKPAPKAAAA